MTPWRCGQVKISKAGISIIEERPPPGTLGMMDPCVEDHPKIR